MDRQQLKKLAKLIITERLPARSLPTSYQEISSDIQSVKSTLPPTYKYRFYVEIGCEITSNEPKERVLKQASDLLFYELNSRTAHRLHDLMKVMNAEDLSRTDSYKVLRDLIEQLS